MLDFMVDRSACTVCGLCIGDCPVRIITLEGGWPAILPENEAACYRCQHCLAICPAAAISILGRDPRQSLPLNGRLPYPEQLETLLKGRRSVRRYRDENLPPEVLDRLLATAWHAPTGLNRRDVLFTVIDDKVKLAALRDEVMAGLADLVAQARLPAEFAFFADFVRLWEEKRVDTLFRGAPHLLVASAPRHGVSPLPNCLIALAYFELFAQSLGVGTVWDGLAKLAINDLLPRTRERLAIPADHLVGYAIAFGPPAVRYSRTVQHGPPLVHRI